MLSLLCVLGVLLIWVFLMHKHIPTLSPAPLCSVVRSSGRQPAEENKQEGIQLHLNVWESGFSEHPMKSM